MCAGLTSHQYACPSLKEDGVALVLITTPNARSGGIKGYVERLISVRDKRGNPVMNTVHIGGKCASCKAAQKPKCAHNAMFLPAHITSARREMVKLLMSADGEATTLIEQELDAAFTSGAEGYLPAEAITTLRKAHAWRAGPEYVIERMYLLVDPSFGGASRTSYTAVFYLPRALEFVITTMGAGMCDTGVTGCHTGARPQKPCSTPPLEPTSSLAPSPAHSPP